MIGCGIATTSAVIFRVPGGHGATCIGGGTLGAAAFAFTGSDSVLTVAVSSLVVAVVGAAIGSAVVFSTATVGVCAATIDAVSKIRVMTANEVTKYLQVDLKPCICFSFFACA
jgi:hypothetical protein